MTDIIDRTKGLGQLTTKHGQYQPKVNTPEMELADRLRKAFAEDRTLAASINADEAKVIIQALEVVA